ncbi:MAG: beta-lactamase family protein [Balneola sp.]|nr:beta-lactamase family protein [Balneola sp.]
MIRFFSLFLIYVITIATFQACTEIKSEPKAVLTEPEKWVMDDSTALFLDKFSADFEEGLKNQRIPGGAVVIVKEGRVIFQQGFGVKESGKTEQVDEHTVFRLGSVSKGFASVLTGVLVDEGLISWDKPVSGYLVDFKLNDPEQTDRVQVKHILSHTSGLPRHAYTNLVEDGLSLDRIIPRLERVPLIAKEGEQLAYQNAAYSVIEKVLEAQTELDFDSLLQQKLFEPLGMINSSANYDSIRYSENKASPHVWYSRAKGRVPVKISKKYYNAISSGGINASASDMGQWLRLLTGYYPEIISEETLNEIFEPIATINNKRFSRYWDGVNKSHYGMGWRILDNEGQKIVYHGGYVNGYRSEIAFDPDNGIGICVLINANSSYPLQVIPGLFEHFRSDSTELIYE